MKQVKVTKTEVYKDSQGEHIVCKGKLVFFYNNTTPLFFKTLSEGTYMADSGFKSKAEGRYCSPIIISETEEVIMDVEYDLFDVYNLRANRFGFHPNLDNNYRVLVGSEQFSEKQIQAIVDGKLKDGDEVFIEVDTLVRNSVRGIKLAKIKLNPNNHVKLFPVPKYNNEILDWLISIGRDPMHLNIESLRLLSDYSEHIKTKA